MCLKVESNLGACQSFLSILFSFLMEGCLCLFWWKQIMPWSSNIQRAVLGLSGELPEALFSVMTHCTFIILILLFKQAQIYFVRNKLIFVSQILSLKAQKQLWGAFVINLFVNGDGCSCGLWPFFLFVGGGKQLLFSVTDS